MSAWPVDTAMSGMLSLVSPAATVPGSVSDPSACALSWQAVTSMVTRRRHLPTWRTSGTCAPAGAFLSVKVPSTAVVEPESEPLAYSAEQLQAAAPVGTPLGSGCSGVAATYTATL